MSTTPTTVPTVRDAFDAAMKACDEADAADEMWKSDGHIAFAKSVLRNLKMALAQGGGSIPDTTPFPPIPVIRW